MHEIMIQICFVVAGVVTGCTDGYVETNNPHLTSQDMAPVYVYDAPQCVSNHYHTSHTPAIRVGPIRLSWPTYTRHHKAHPWCANTHSHYHGNHWFTWKKRYGHSRWKKKRGHKHHAHKGHARHWQHKKPKVNVTPKRKSKVVVHRSHPSRVIVKSKVKRNSHDKRHNARPKANKHKKRNIAPNRHGPARVIIKHRQSPKRNWKRQPRPKVHIPNNLYSPNPKKKGKKKGKKNKKRNKRSF